MTKEIDISVAPQLTTDDNHLKEKVASLLQLNVSEVSFVKILKRSVDARSKNIKIHLKVLVYINESAPENTIPLIEYPDVSKKSPVIIIGAGPAGLFASLKLIQRGFKPIILERGKNVRDRRRDLAAINKEHIVHPDSNYCFGE